MFSVLLFPFGFLEIFYFFFLSTDHIKETFHQTSFLTRKQEQRQPVEQRGSLASDIREISDNTSFYHQLLSLYLLTERKFVVPDIIILIMKTLCCLVLCCVPCKHKITLYNPPHTLQFYFSFLCTFLSFSHSVWLQMQKPTYAQISLYINAATPTLLCLLLS